MKSALIIIDMQRDLFASPKHDADGLVERLNALSRRIRASGGIIVFIQHEGLAGVPGVALHIVAPAHVAAHHREGLDACEEVEQPRRIPDRAPLYALRRRAAAAKDFEIFDKPGAGRPMGEEAALELRAVLFPPGRRP